MKALFTANSFVIKVLLLIACAIGLSNCTTIGMILISPFAGAKGPDLVTVEEALVIDASETRDVERELYASKKSTSSGLDTRPIEIVPDVTIVFSHGMSYPQDDASLRLVIRNNSNVSARILIDSIALNASTDFPANQIDRRQKLKALYCVKLTRQSVDSVGIPLGESTIWTQGDSEIKANINVIEPGASAMYYVWFRTEGKDPSPILRRKSIYSMLVQTTEGGSSKRIIARLCVLESGRIL